MTVRMDSELKKSFDSLCSQFGLSANSAMNVFAKAVVQRAASLLKSFLTRLLPQNERKWLLTDISQKMHLGGRTLKASSMSL